MTRENVYMRFIVAMGIVLCFSLSVKNINANNTDNLIIDLKSKDFETRMQAVEELGKDIDKNTLDVFKKYVFVKTEDWKIKTKAIDTFGDESEWGILTVTMSKTKTKLSFLQFLLERYSYILSILVNKLILNSFMYILYN